jgi:hypothetical protein
MIQIELENRDLKFKSGDRITGTVQWGQLKKSPDQIDIRLIWYTTGKGDTDSQIVNSKLLQSPLDQGSERFEFIAPHRPFSFSGKLISLMWAIEVTAYPGKDTERIDFVISPHGQPVILTPLDGVK